MLSAIFEARRALVTAFISSRLDYCNAILYGIAACNTQRLQVVMNAAARLVTSTGRHEHITPVLHDVVHWLPVSQRIIFKIAVFASVFAVLDQPTSMTSAPHWRTFLVVLVFARQNEVNSSCQLHGRILVVAVFALLHLPSGTHYLSNCMRQLSADNNSKWTQNHLFKAAYG